MAELIEEKKKPYGEKTVEIKSYFHFTETEIQAFLIALFYIIKQNMKV